MHAADKTTSDRNIRYKDSNYIHTSDVEEGAAFSMEGDSVLYRLVRSLE